MKDYLAIVLIGGGSSFGRHSDPDEVVSLATEFLVSDWGHLYKLDGVEVKVNLYDVTGNDQVWWDDCGVHSATEAEYPIQTLEMRTVKLPKKRRKAS